VVFVRHTLPGEVVEAEVTEGKPGDKFWRADAVSILEASPDRVPSVWPEAGPGVDRIGGGGGVGGGELAHVALPAQREWKRAVLSEAFQRFANVDYVGSVASAPGDDERGGLRYRTRVGAIGGPDGRASMRVFRSRTLRPLTSMPLATEDAETALLGATFPEGREILVIDASGEDGVKVVVDGLPRRGSGPDRRPNAPSHVREVVAVDSTSAVDGTSGVVAHRYRVAAAGFWQVHRDAPSVLVGEVMSRVGDAARVLDLYSGSGLFTVPLAASGREVVSVESDDAAVRDARRNLHAYPTATVVHGDVRETLRTAIGAFEAVVLDPPRSGAGRSTLDAVSALAPAQVVYVACDPVALARDVATLRDLGYDLASYAAWDLFPMTHHIEVVATFIRS
jgi:tRNA/tmRNA/rRNA uracil-C5-methylase (TrmA/RlmC/RlmD family)